jgi:hypothetical protein
MSARSPWPGPVKSPTPSPGCTRLASSSVPSRLANEAEAACKVDDFNMANAKAAVVAEWSRACRASRDRMGEQRRDQGEMADKR